MSVVNTNINLVSYDGGRTWEDYNEVIQSKHKDLLLLCEELIELVQPVGFYKRDMTTYKERLENLK